MGPLSPCLVVGFITWGSMAGSRGLAHCLGQSYRLELAGLGALVPCGVPG